MEAVTVLLWCAAALPLSCVLFGAIQGLFDPDIPDITHSDIDPEM
jgi:hypothetical protein